MTARAEARSILLVGGDGFLGSHVARALLTAGRAVTTLSRGHHDAIPGAERLIADRRDPAALARVLSGRRFDLTVDLSAYEARDLETLWRVPGAVLGRTVMISTGQVYMVTESRRRAFREPDSRARPMPEPAADSPDHPQWAYGVGKRAAEATLLALRRHHGVRALILRIPVVQGEGDPTLRLWAWLERMLDGEPVLLPDGGTRATRFLYAGDVGLAMERLASGDWPRAAVLNLAAPRVTRLGRFLELAARAAGLAPEFVPIPSAEMARHGLRFEAWPFAGRWSSVLDPARARREWRFVGTMPEAYLPRVVRWHLDHRRGESHPGYTQRPAEMAAADLLRGHATKAGAGARASEIGPA